MRFSWLENAYSGSAHFLRRQYRVVK